MDILTKIETLVDQANERMRGSPGAISGPCSEEEIAAADARFKAAFGQPFPEAYKRVLRRANGVYYDGLVIWPAKTEEFFDETIHQANNSLSQDFSEDYIYWGNMDEELYVFDLRTRGYCAIEYVGKPVWMRFENAEEMFVFMLERALE